MPADLQEGPPAEDPSGEDIVWFEPELLAQRSSIAPSPVGPQRRRGWWCPEDLADASLRQTPCWGAMAPCHLQSQGAASPLWNHPDLALVKRWSKASSLAIEAKLSSAAYALLDQMLESLVVSNLFEREPELHRAVLVSDRCAQAWWEDLLRRWQFTCTPEGHPVDARHPDFARHWLLVSWDVWEQDRLSLEHWLHGSPGQRALGFHLARNHPRAASLIQPLRQELERTKLLVAGHPQALDAVGWDPRDRIRLQWDPNHPQGCSLSWELGQGTPVPLHHDPATGVYYF